MGWLRTLFLGDIGNRLDIADVERDLQELRDTKRGHLHAHGTRIEGLEAEVDHLKLCIAALVRLLDQRGIVPHEDMKKMIDALDREDGVADGRVGRPPGSQRT